MNVKLEDQRKAPVEKKSAKEIERAIKKVHPWEQVDIEFVPLEKI